VRFANFVWQAGGEVCREVDGVWRLSVDEDNAIKAFRFYREMAWGKWIRPSDGKELQSCLKVESAGQEMLHFVESRAAMTIVSTRGDVGRYLQSGLDPRRSVSPPARRSRQAR